MKSGDTAKVSANASERARDRQTDRQRQRETERDRERERSREREREMRHREKFAIIHKEKGLGVDSFSGTSELKNNFNIKHSWLRHCRKG